MSREARSRPTSIAIYSLAFLAMLGGGVAIVLASLGSLQSTRVLWLSAGLSYAAVVLALLSLLLPPAR